VGFDNILIPPVLWRGSFRDERRRLLVVVKTASTEAVDKTASGLLLLLRVLST
jgi:hypothetical protein